MRIFGSGGSSTPPDEESNSSFTELLFRSYLGDGSDGTVVLDGVATYSFATLVGSKYTLTRDIFTTTCLINSGIVLDTASYRLFATTSFTNNGTMQAIAMYTAASGFTAGTWATTNGIQRLLSNGRSGGNGGATTTGVAGTSGSNSRGGNSGAGGAVGATAGGAGVNNTINLPQANLDLVNPQKNPLYAVMGSLSANGGAFVGGPGGGGGASVDASHRGGGGGGGGPVILINSPLITNNGAINAPGQNGAASPSSSNGGGGGGGGGGWIILNTLQSILGSGTTDISGGLHGNGVGTGTNGVDGLSGTVTVNIWS